MDDNLVFIDLAIYMPTYKTLIIADTHIGYEEYLNKKGVMVPRHQLKDTIKRLEPILKKTKPEIIIINGDVKHEFGTISKQEWNDTLRLIDFLNKHSKKIILIKGNHDTILEPIANKRNITIVEQFLIDNYLIIHGDKIPTSLPKVKTIIIGHEHPAVSLKEDVRVEKFKCFLVGKYRTYNLIVQPSFNLVTDGTDVLSDRLLSPFLKNIDNFEIYVPSKDTILPFGKVKNNKF